MNYIEIEELLKVGAHFGHPTSKWNPKFSKYIATKKNGVHIIDLNETIESTAGPILELIDRIMSSSNQPAGTVSNEKINGLDKIIHLLEKKTDKKIILCHGVFDLLHIGHIKYFQEAKSMGDVLIVTITPDRHVGKGPGRPAFNEKHRAEAIAALDVVLPTPPLPEVTTITFAIFYP